MRQTNLRALSDSPVNKVEKVSHKIGMILFAGLLLIVFSSLRVKTAKY